MAINMTRARALCSKPELELVLQTTAAHLNGLPERRLRANIAKARTLRNKFRDLAAQQRREARGKQVPRSSRAAQSNANTVAKQRLFDEVLTRFQQQYERVQAGEVTHTPKQARRARKTARQAAKQERKAARRTVKKATAAEQSAPASTDRTPAAGNSKVQSGKKKTGAKRKTQKAVAASAVSAATARKQPAKKLSARSVSRKTHAESTTGIRSRKNQQRSGLTKLQAHVSSRGRRQQARRDSR